MGYDLRKRKFGEDFKTIVLKGVELAEHDLRKSLELAKANEKFISGL